MSVKKSVPGSSGGSRPAVKIGSRVRCTEDGVEGRITWANGVAVKVQWDDGEHVTWRRDSLAERPIEILDPADEEEPDAVREAPTDEAQSVLTESPREELSPRILVPEKATIELTQSAAEIAAPVTEPATTERVAPVPGAVEAQTIPAIADAKAETLVTSNQRRKAPAAPKEKRLSALDAAAKMLAETGRAMTCQELIEGMAQRGYWTSPKGRTPVATLYAAILRETQIKGATSRFVKTERGKFARTTAV